MLKTGASIFFKNKADYEGACQKDPFGRGYIYKQHPIEYPEKFPAAFGYQRDFDPRYVGAYVVKNFDQAYSAAKSGLESTIMEAEEDLILLEKLKNEYDCPF